MKTAQQEPRIILTANISTIAEMMDVSTDEAIQMAPTHPLLEDLGHGVFNVWSGKHSNVEPKP